MTFALSTDGRIATGARRRVAASVDRRSTARISGTASRSAVRRPTRDRRASIQRAASTPSATNRCRGSRVALDARGERARACTLDVRAFDDGVGVPVRRAGAAAARTPDEATTFTLPGGRDRRGRTICTATTKACTCAARSTDVPAGDWAAPPLTYKLPGDAGYASITESALTGYGGMALQADGQRRLSRRGSATRIRCRIRIALRYTPEDIARLSKPAAIAGTITTPWRVVIAGADSERAGQRRHRPQPRAAARSRALSAGAGDRVGQAGTRGLALSSTAARTRSTGVKGFTELAEKLGFEYHVVEGVWRRGRRSSCASSSTTRSGGTSGSGCGSTAASCRRAEAAARVLRLLRDARRRRRQDRLLRSRSEGDDRSLQSILREAAARHIMVDFHGANKPTGEDAHVAATS